MFHRIYHTYIIEYFISLIIIQISFLALQPPTLSYLNISDNKVRLGINRPIGSFDYVQVDCSDNISYIIFNSSISSNTSLITVDCSFLPNLPLMSFILKTIKENFYPAVTPVQSEGKSTKKNFINIFIYFSSTFTDYIYTFSQCTFTYCHSLFSTNDKYV